MITPHVGNGAVMDTVLADTVLAAFAARFVARCDPW